MNRVSLINFLAQYKPTSSEEQLYIPRFLELLAQQDCYERTHLPGHITGSAWIINEARTHALLVLHGKLNRWMQPGGHADGDENILRVALKEAEEETGLTRLKIASPIPFDLDVHPIPARTDFPLHDHYDVRFLFEAVDHQPIVVSHESHDVRWIPLPELSGYTQERSVLRMREKLFGAN